MIEVLIAISIVSVVLGGAFASSNRSLNSTQNSKERDLALRVTESQIERIHGSLAVNPAPLNAQANGFCITNGTAIIDNSGISPPAVQADTLTVVASGGKYDPQCVVDASGTQYASGASSTPFYVYIEVSSPNTYTAHIRWKKVGGGDNQETTLIYRQY